MWPAVVVTEELAYRTATACWSVAQASENTDDSEGLGRSFLEPDGLQPVASTLEDLSCALRTGARPVELGHLSYGDTELHIVRTALGGVGGVTSGEPG